MEDYLLIQINLQLFADDGDKTEEPTQKKKDEARKKGQVPKSQDLPQVASFLAGIMMLKLLFKVYYSFLSSNLKGYLKDIYIENFSIEKIDEIFLKAMIMFAILVLPILFSVLIVAIFANFVQVGLLFTTETLKPSFEKLSILKGIKNLFSLKKLIELLKTIIKLIIIAVYVYFSIKKDYVYFLKLLEMGFLDAFLFIFNLTYEIAFKISIALFFISILDYLYQKWEHNKSLRMSKQEIKDEFKQAEGDPQIKQKMRQFQRNLIKKQMMQDVPKATVVITNPTHLSIALQYEKGMTAPKLLAKGADNVAFKIREIANEHKIPLVENKPLARALYKEVEVGDEIPEMYYQVVAEILSIIWKNK